MDGYGDLGAPNAAAVPLMANDLATVHPSPKAPPGLYGTAGGRRALNLGAVLPLPAAAPPIPGAAQEDLAGAQAERPLGPPLVALALLLLIFDLLASLALRGSLRGESLWQPRRRVVARMAKILLLAGVGLPFSSVAHSAPVPPAALADLSRLCA